MIGYMEILPLRCPKCNKKLLHIINANKNIKKYSKTKNNIQYSKCPICDFITKNDKSFIDNKEVNRRNNLNNYKITTNIAESPSSKARGS